MKWNEIFIALDAGVVMNLFNFNFCIFILMKKLFALLFYHLQSEITICNTQRASALFLF